MIRYLLFPVRLFLLIYGVVLLRASKCRNIGITLTTLLLAPVALIVFLVWYMDYDKIDCLLHSDDQSKCTLENNWEY